MVVEYNKSNSGDRIALELTDNGINFEGYPNLFTGEGNPPSELGKNGDVYVKF